jgi:hypothetical protein
MPETVLVGSTAIAKVLNGKSIRRIQQLVQEEVITATKVKGVNKYDLALVAKQYIKHLEDKLAGQEDRSRSFELEHEKLDVDIDYKKSKAAIIDLELKELQGKMHRSEDVAAMTEDLIYTIRGMMVALPGRLAIDAANLTDAAEVSELIRREAYCIMDELSRYRYDSKKYAARVRKRRKWEKANHGDGADGTG